MTDLSSRLGLPFLHSGQAQKEVSHNEALKRLDFLVQPIVQALAPAVIPPTPVEGQCWIVGSGASGLWSGHDAHLACWSDGGWRFAAPFEAMTCWSVADGCFVQFGTSGWIKGEISARSVKIGGVQLVGSRQAAIVNPSGGSSVDTEARLAVTQILSALRIHGLIST